MTTIYQGIDIVEISRFSNLCKRTPDFIRDTFTETEQTYCMSKKDPYTHLAGRFAAKEACLKALGVGISGIGHTLKEIEIISARSGKPEIALNGWAGKIRKRRKIAQLTVSISHTGDYAAASVIMIGI